MNAVKINNGNNSEYLLSIRLLVKPDGSTVALIGNVRLTLSTQEVVALRQNLLTFSSATSSLQEVVSWQ